MKNKNFPRCRPLPAQIKVNSVGVDNTTIFDVDQSLTLTKSNSTRTYALVDTKYNIVRLVSPLTPSVDFQDCEVNQMCVVELEHENEQLWNMPIGTDNVPLVDAVPLTALVAANTLPFLVPHMEKIKDPVLNDDEECCGTC